MRTVSSEWHNLSKELRAQKGSDTNIGDELHHLALEMKDLADCYPTYYTLTESQNLFKEVFRRSMSLIHN
jgi:hypothetical protein